MRDLLRKALRWIGFKLIKKSSDIGRAGLQLPALYVNTIFHGWVDNEVRSTNIDGARVIWLTIRPSPDISESSSFQKDLSLCFALHNQGSSIAAVVDAGLDAVVELRRLTPESGPEKARHLAKCRDLERRITEWRSVVPND